VAINWRPNRQVDGDDVLRLVANSRRVARAATSTETTTSAFALVSQCARTEYKTSLIV
jgi:hypothetical protein